MIHWINSVQSTPLFTTIIQDGTTLHETESVLNEPG
jgi:hypothetical protein